MTGVNRSVFLWLQLRCTRRGQPLLKSPFINFCVESYSFQQYKDKERAVGLKLRGKGPKLSSLQSSRSGAVGRPMVAAITLLHFYTFILLHFYTFILLYFYTFTLLHFYTFTLLHFYTFTLLRAHYYKYASHCHMIHAHYLYTGTSTQELQHQYNTIPLLPISQL